MSDSHSSHPVSRKPIDWWRWVGRLTLVLLLIFTVMPMLWMVLTSVKSQFAAMQYPPQWWPAEPTLNNYWRLINPADQTGREFLRYFWNSFYVSLLTTILGVVIAVPAAYAFSRFRFPGRTFLFFTVLVRNMFPAVVFLMPLFLLMRWMGLVNTHGSLILTYLTFGLPLSIWLLKGFFDNIPIQLEQAARIDGATRFQAFLLIVMPLSTPGIIATSIFSFIGAWNEYVYAYTFLSKQESMTLPVGIQRFFTEFATDWPGPDGCHLPDERARRRAVPDPAEILRACPHRRRRQTLAGGLMAQVVLKDVSKSYGSMVAVNDISFKVEDGEFVALVGPSGCGKTTTLNLIAGLIPLTSGEIVIGDREVSEPRSQGPRHRYGVPELCALSEQDGIQQSRLPAADAQAGQGRHRSAKCGKRRRFSISPICSTAVRASFPAASSSASRSAALWCAIRQCS